MIDAHAIWRPVSWFPLVQYRDWSPIVHGGRGEIYLLPIVRQYRIGFFLSEKEQGK